MLLQDLIYMDKYEILSSDLFATMLRIRIRIRVKRWIQTCIKIKSRIRIRIKVKIQELWRLKMEPWRTEDAHF
jgi:hypothetical protein